MKTERKKIFGRVQTNVDDRTGGIHTATRATNALGNTRSSQVVNTNPSKGFNAWAAFLPSLKSAFQAGEKILNKKESEEERLRRKAEAEMDNRLKQLQAWEANKWTLDLEDRLNKAIDGGEIGSSEELTEWVRRDTEGLDASQDAAFIQTARPELARILKSSQDRIYQKAQGEFNANIVGQVQDGIAKAITTQDFNTPEGQAVLADAREQGRVLFQAAGKTTLEYDAVELKSLHQAARNAIREDPARAMALLDIAETVTGAYESTSTLRTDLERELNEWSDKEEAKARKDEVQQQQASLATLRTGIGKAETADALVLLRQQALSNESDMRNMLGDALYVEYLESIARQEAHLTNVDTRQHALDERASARKYNDYVLQLNRGDEVGFQEIRDNESGGSGDGGLLQHHVTQLEAYKESEDRKLGEAAKPLVDAVVDSIASRLPKEGKFQGGYTVRNGVAEFEPYMKIRLQGAIGAEIRGVMRSKRDYPTDAEYTAAVHTATEQTIEKGLRGEYFEDFKSPKDSAPGASTVRPQFDPENMTLEDLDKFPALQADLEKRLFSGRDFVRTALVDGHTAGSRFNGGFFKKLNPSLKPLAKNLVFKRTAEERAERYRIDDEKEERVRERLKDGLYFTNLHDDITPGMEFVNPHNVPQRGFEPDFDFTKEEND